MFDPIRYENGGGEPPQRETGDREPLKLRVVTSRPAPKGTVTLLFTDIEGSTNLLRRLGDRYADALLTHQRLLRAAFEAHGGYEVDTQGDSFLVAFARASDALLAAIEAQTALARMAWPDEVQVRVRMALHTGEPQLVDGRYIGLDVHRGARICAAGHGGQVLLSGATVKLVEPVLPRGVTLRDLGEHRLKDLQRRTHLFQLLISDLPVDFPPLRSLAAYRHNLPVQATPLVGRAEQVRALADLLRRAEVRLVTLTGPGGVGKTRLSLQLAAETLDLFPDGALFVPLAPITDPALVPAAIAQALDIQESGGRPMLEAVKERLRDVTLLLVLDNFEQVVAAGPVVTSILAAAPGVKVVVSSRAVLHVYGEHEFAAPPLPRQAGVELFVQRAQAVKPGFRLTSESEAAIVEICARLDGLALAIELAASRVKLLAPSAILQQLKARGIGALPRGAIDKDIRHQSLADCIGWSYSLLDAAKRALFRRLAVFMGGFTLEAVEGVIGDWGLETRDWRLETRDFPNSQSPIPNHQSPVSSLLDGVAALVDESLLRQEEDESGEPRFVMLETIREYALERLRESGEEEQARQRHAAYFLALAEEARPKLWGAEQVEWLKRLDREIDNLRATLSFSLNQSDCEALLRLTSALWLFWYQRGLLSEGRRWLEAALERMETTQRQMPLIHSNDPLYYDRLKVRVLHGAGTLAYNQGDYAAARVLHEQALALRRILGDGRGEASTLIQLGEVARVLGEYAAAREILQDAIQRAQVLNDLSLLSGALNNLAATMHNSGDYEQARLLYQDGLKLLHTLGDQRGAALVLNNLGEVAFDEGDVDTAQTYIEQSLALSRELGYHEGILFSLINLGDILQDQKRFDEARALYDEGVALAEAAGNRKHLADALRGAAEVAIDSNECDTALRHLRHSLKLRSDLGDMDGGVETLEALVRLFTQCSEPVRAVKLLSFATAWRARTTTPRSRPRQLMLAQIHALLQAALESSIYQDAWEKGQRLSLNEAREVALEIGHRLA